MRPRARARGEGAFIEREDNASNRTVIGARVAARSSPFRGLVRGRGLRPTRPSRDLAQVTKTKPFGAPRAWNRAPFPGIIRGLVPEPRGPPTGGSRTGSEPLARSPPGGPRALPIDRIPDDRHDGSDRDRDARAAARWRPHRAAAHRARDE